MRGSSRIPEMSWRVLSVNPEFCDKFRWVNDERSRMFFTPASVISPPQTSRDCSSLNSGRNRRTKVPGKLLISICHMHIYVYNYVHNFLIYFEGYYVQNKRNWIIKRSRRKKMNFFMIRLLTGLQGY